MGLGLVGHYRQDRESVVGVSGPGSTPDVIATDGPLIAFGLDVGQLDYGYLPAQDLSQKTYFISRGYKVASWPDLGFNAHFLNFTNPVVGPIFEQLYVRRAMRDLINQPQRSKHIFDSQAFPTHGPDPIEPPNE